MLRRRTNCHVEGHGTRCEPSWERRDDAYCRATEERIAMEFEALANTVAVVETEFLSPEEAPS